jgi:hypothetical protein
MFSLQIPPYLLLFAASIILMSNGFVLRHKKSLQYVGLVFGAIGLLAFFTATGSFIPIFWRGVIIAIGVIVIILLHLLRGKSKPTPQVAISKPSINYGRIIVKNRTQKMHGGTYDVRSYYIEIINNVPSTVARNCKGFLEMPNEQIHHVTIWDDGLENADIGHNRLLYLFEITTFEKESERTQTFLYFHWDSRVVDEYAEQSYKNRLDKNLKVFMFTCSHSSKYVALSWK